MSLRNRTTERGGRQNGCMRQTWQGYYWHVLLRSPLNINVFLVFYKKICLKKVEVWGKFFSNKIIVTLVTQGLRLRSSSVLLRKFTENGPLISHLLQAPLPVRPSSAPGTWCPFVSGTVRDLHRWALTSQSYWSAYYPQIQRGQRLHLREDWDWFRLSSPSPWKLKYIKTWLSHGQRNFKPRDIKASLLKGLCRPFHQSDYSYDLHKWFR